MASISRRSRASPRLRSPLAEDSTASQSTSRWSAMAPATSSSRDESSACRRGSAKARPPIAPPMPTAFPWTEYGRRGTRGRLTAELTERRAVQTPPGVRSLIVIISVPAVSPPGNPIIETVGLSTRPRERTIHPGGRNVCYFPAPLPPVAVPAASRSTTAPSRPSVRQRSSPPLRPSSCLWKPSM